MGGHGWRLGEGIVVGPRVFTMCGYGGCAWGGDRVRIWWVDLGWPLGAGIVCALGEGVQ